MRANCPIPVGGLPVEGFRSFWEAWLEPVLDALARMQLLWVKTSPRLLHMISRVRYAAWTANQKSATRWLPSPLCNSPGGVRSLGVPRARRCMCLRCNRVQGTAETRLQHDGEFLVRLSGQIPGSLTISQRVTTGVYFHTTVTHADYVYVQTHVHVSSEWCVSGHVGPLLARVCVLQLFHPGGPGARASSVRQPPSPHPRPGATEAAVSQHRPQGRTVHISYSRQ